MTNMIIHNVCKRFTFIVEVKKDVFIEWVTASLLQNNGD